MICYLLSTSQSTVPWQRFSTEDHTDKSFREDTKFSTHGFLDICDGGNGVDIDRTQIGSAIIFKHEMCTIPEHQRR